MNIVFFDDQTWKNLNPITLTKPVADVRIGILKISEKWKYFFSGNLHRLEPSKRTWYSQS